jgi:hypothetical protein
LPRRHISQEPIQMAEDFAAKPLYAGDALTQKAAVDE